MSIALALALKDLRLLARDRAALFFTFVFPLLLAIFFGMIFGGGGGATGKMKIAVADEDGGAAAGAFTADLLKADGLEVEKVPSRAEGETLVRKGKAVACVVVPKGFQEQADGMFAGKSMEIEGFVDPAHKAEAGLLTGKLNEIAFMQMQRSFTDAPRMSELLTKARASVATAADMDPARRALLTGLFGSLDQLTRSVDALSSASAPKADAPGAEGGAGVGWRPVTVTVSELAVTSAGPQNSFEVSFPQGVVWGLMGCVMAFGPSLAEERARGTLMRLTTAPISRAHVLAGKALGCFIACLLVQVLLLGMAVLIFKVEVRQPLIMVVAVLMSSIGFVGVMMAMAGLSRTEQGASGMGRALVLVLAMIGGGTIPLFFMPPFMQTVSSVSPFRWATIMIEGALWRGFTPGDMLLPAAVMLGFGLVGFVVGSSAMKWSEGA